MNAVPAFKLTVGFGLLVVLSVTGPDIWAASSALKGESYSKALKAAEGASPNKRSLQDGRTALMGLAGNAHLSPEEKEAVARRIVERGADLSLIDDQGNTVLHHAVLGRAPALARYLIGKGADQDFPNLGGYSPFQLAMKTGDPLLVTLFLDNARVIDNRNILGQSALYEAAESGQLDLVKRLLGKGADPASSQKTALMGAVIAGQVAVARHLIEVASVPADGRTQDGETPLMGAAAVGHLELAKYLVETRGVEINAVSSKGGTPLMFAAKAGHMSMVGYLLEHGAALEKSTPTALSAAAHARQQMMVEFLIERGADLGPGFAESPGPLYWAVSGGGFEVARTLIRKGVVFPFMPPDTAPLVLAELHREFARGQVDRGVREESIQHLRGAAKAFETVAGELLGRSREVHAKANKEIAWRFALNVLSIAAGAASTHSARIQARTHAEIAALRFSADRGTGLPGYYAALSAYRQVAVPLPLDAAPPAATLGAGGESWRAQARMLEAEAERFAQESERLRSIADCISALAPNTPLDACPWASGPAEVSAKPKR